MRILYLSPSAGLGGAERALLEILRAIRQREPSWSLRLIAFEDGPLVERARDLGVNAMTSPMPGVFAATGEFGRTEPAVLLRLTRSVPSTLSFARALRREIAEWRPHVVHSNGIKSHLLSPWICGDAPLVWHVHDYLSARSVSARLLRRQARSAAAVVANSQSVAADVLSIMGPHVRVETIYNAIDARRFRPEGPSLDLDAASRLPAPQAQQVRVGLVGTFARWKGQDVFLRALAGLSALGVRAYIVGGPVYRTGAASQFSVAELRELACSLDVASMVGFTGFVDEPADAYRALDIVVHASTRPEPFGLCIAEAMACGRAVVISDAGGAREIGEPGRTFLTHAPGDHDGLRARLLKLVADAGLRRRLGRAAADCVSQRFSAAVVIEPLSALYRELASESCLA